MSTARPDSPDSRYHTGNGGYTIGVHSLSKHFSDKYVMKDLSVQVARGEIFGLLDLNGSGKTTSTRMTCGLLTPDSDSGSCFGYDIPKQSVQIKRRVGHMTQRFLYWDDLSIRKNLDFAACLYEMPNRHEAVDHALEHLGLASCARQLAGPLPGGWKQCLALAVCMFHKPELLLLNEPTVGVDPKACRDFWEELHRLAVEGVSVLVSTHYMDEAERCHKLVCIAYGELLVRGIAGEVIAAQHLLTWPVSGGNLVELGRKPEGQPGVDQAVVFGSVLHVTGAGAQALEGMLHKPAGESGMCAEPIDIGPEDVFIHTMRHSSDNYGTQP